MGDPLLQIEIPDDMKPADGRFGCGPSKVRPESLDALARTGAGYLGTSHRQPAVKSVVKDLQEGLRTLFALPDDYEVVLGNGGATAFWECAVFGLIEKQSQHLVFGEFSSKFAKAVAAAPHLEEPEVVQSEYGTHPIAHAHDHLDAYALTHNETSTGVCMELTRPPGAHGLVLVDATSAAGGMPVDPASFDVYYFSPQKCFASDGGLWAALCSPSAVERIERLAATDRWIPSFLSLSTALENSRKNQTYNTPALTTLFTFAHTVRWMNESGGLSWATGRSAKSSGILYDWAESVPFARPFVDQPDERSKVTCTIDFDEAVDAGVLAKVLRANGIVDTEAYRKLGRNQLRIATFPAVEPSDVEALTRCLDFVAERLTR